MKIWVLVANASKARLFSVGKVDGEMIEITTFRTEKYKTNNRKPDVKYVKHISEDLSRRDFTINAICIKISKLVDYYKKKDKK